jgi:hypothetical protein
MHARDLPCLRIRCCCFGLKLELLCLLVFVSKPRVLSSVVRLLLCGVLVFLPFPFKVLEHATSRAVWRVAGEDCKEAALHTPHWRTANSMGKHCCKIK